MKTLLVLLNVQSTTDRYIKKQIQRSRILMDLEYVVYGGGGTDV